MQFGFQTVIFYSKVLRRLMTSKAVDSNSKVHTIGWFVEPYQHD